jgi:hypothetical protein
MKNGGGGGGGKEMVNAGSQARIEVINVLLSLIIGRHLENMHFRFRSTPAD